MLEGLAAWILNTYLGQYLENLNTDQLSIGLLRGEVELENVPLKKDALRHLDMALEVRSGFVGKVKLQIPVARLRSEPWIIAFEQLYLIAGPININEYDAEAEEALSQSQKISQLDAIEAAWFSEQDATGDESNTNYSYSTWLSYGTSFISHIIENIQLKIKDVHIRYEDDQANTSNISAFGITIESLSVQSSDEHWIPKFILPGGSQMSYKLLELKNMGIYLDTSVAQYSDKSFSDLINLMSISANKASHSYILEPVSSTACLKRNLCTNPLRSRQSPRYTCDLKLENFFLSLTDSQYNQLIKSLRSYDCLETARPHRKWRPKCPQVIGNCKSWWRYAINCHLDGIQRKCVKRNWEYVLKRARENCRYVEIYCCHLRNPVSVSAELKSERIELEHEFAFEELKILRNISMEKVNREKLPSKNGSSHEQKENVSNISSGESLLQRWFPSWGGWYASGNLNEDEILQAMSTDETNLQDDTEFNKQYLPSRTKSSEEEHGTTLEEEILYVLSDSLENNSFMKRDAVFCHLSFSLKQGYISIKKALKDTMDNNGNSSSALFILDFSSVKLALESRPRHHAYTFDIELGSMSLKDQVTENTAFPLLISQQRENPLFSNKSGLLRGSGMYAKLSSMISSVSKISQVQTSTSTSQGPLFSLIYERKPKNAKFDRKLVINSQSLDVIYNKAAFSTIYEFFYPNQLRRSDTQSFLWNSSASKRYEMLKQHTKDELKKNWNNIIQGFMAMERKKWDIQLDISAPQIIIPEHFQDVNAAVVVLDFGKLNFSSVQTISASDKSATTDPTPSTDDDDAFATPFSTPEEFAGIEESSLETTVPESAMSEATLHQHLYDKYELRLCEIQVLVAKVRDNWKFAYQKGTGPMHIIDRFSINLQLEKRVLDVIPESPSTKEWPNITLSGSLPQLVFHVNDHKIRAIRNVLSGAFPSSYTPTSLSKDFPQEEEKTFVHSHTMTSLNEAAEIDKREDLSLIVMQFTVDKLSLELQSRGRSLAELQVTGVRTHLCKRPTDTTVLLSVHSLLLVDALQTFGPDFELLVASHKHISMDSVSGSLLDSEPCSPTSPASPDLNIAVKPTSPVALSQAISSLALNRASSPISEAMNVQSPPIVSPTFGPNLSYLDGRDSEALITWELTYIAPASDVGGHIISSLQFNALDVIANQETTVELVGFVHQIISLLMTPLSSSETAVPSVKSPQSISEELRKNDKEEEFLPELRHHDVEEGASSSFYGSIASLYPPADSASNNGSLKIQASFDFHKLTILLLRGALKEKETIGRKVGTAVLSEAKIEVNIDSDILTAEGSLGGFQIRDVTPESNKHQCIISVGHDPIVERSQAFVTRMNMGIYQSMLEQQIEKANKAFSFKIVRPLLLNPSTEDILRSHYEHKEDDSTQNKLNIMLHLASVCYTHSPQFLAELKSCASEFKQYMAVVAKRIKQAATDMAIGLVKKRIESFAGLSGVNRDGSLRHRLHLNSSRSTDTLHFPNPPPSSIMDSATLSPTQPFVPDLSFNLLLNVILETPILVLPENPSSPNVLVAHLGQISLKNSSNTQEAASSLDEIDSFSASRHSEFLISVKDMNLYSLNIEERLRSRDMNFGPLSTTMMCAEELYSCKKHGSPILHSTSIELHLTQKRIANPTEFFGDLSFGSSLDSFVLTGGVVTPIKVSLSHKQYHHLLQSLDNLSLSSSSSPQGNSHSEKSDKTRMGLSKEGHDLNQESQYAFSSHKPLKAEFKIPTLSVELRGDAGNEEKSLANLLLEEISATYDASSPYETITTISLLSLILEDLNLSSTDPSHKYLMKSESCTDKKSPLKGSIPIPCTDSQKVDFFSSSCPDQLFEASHGAFSSFSLPSKMELEKPFVQILTKEENKRKGESFSQSLKGTNGSFTPFSPPKEESTQHRNSLKEKELVTIIIYNVSEDSPEFMSKYHGNHRHLDVDFNSLVTVINLESWVMLFDFFRASPTYQDSTLTSTHDSLESASDDIPKKELNVVMEIQVHSLSLILNKVDSELACANINEVSVRSVGSEGNITLNGVLGSLSIVDQTSYGSLYPEKFLTTGSEAMSFQLFRYSKPDPKIERECDVRLNLKMSSIMYVHSQRFFIEMTNFVQQFFILRDMLSDWRAESAGLKLLKMTHGTRVSLEITAGSPVIFIPMSNKSKELLIGDLGSISVSNKFIFAGSHGTISEVRREDLVDRLLSSSSGHSRKASLTRSRSRSSSNRRLLRQEPEKLDKRRGNMPLLDVMQVSLVNMDLFVGSRVSEMDFRVGKPTNPKTNSYTEMAFSWDFGSYEVKRKGPPLLKDKCALKLQLERNLDSHKSRIVPDYSVHGILTKVHATINTFTFMLTRGLLAYNLGEPIPECSSSATHHFYQDAAKSQRESLGQNHLWTTLNINMDLDNVIVDGEMSDETLHEKPTAPFASIKFIKSRLTYESYSDTSKDVDLVSQEILINDTRFKYFPANKRSNLFTSILQPAQDLSLKNENPLQAEVHFRSTKDVTRFTILLNNMRLMAIFDWWKIAHAFIQSSFPNPHVQDDHSSGQQGKKETEDTSFLLFDGQQSNLSNLAASKGAKAFPRLNPIVESTGLMTKHDLIKEDYQVVLEFKLNITDSEVVFVENSNMWDSSALILKTTSVISYRPHFQERPISCNLNHCELFSCLLGNEEESALSIIDPVTVNIEVHDQLMRNMPLDTIDIGCNHQHILEISLHQLNIRLSYHDMKLFQRILESFPKPQRDSSPSSHEHHSEPANVKAQIDKLVALGFSKIDCQSALKECQGELNEAALWLTQHCQPEPVLLMSQPDAPHEEKTINISGVEVKTGSVNLCIIDDCGDCDVPLLEVSMSHLGLKQTSDFKGSCNCVLSVDYYNRALSGWEPFIEPWKCNYEWKKEKLHSSEVEKIKLSLATKETVNVTISSTFIELCYLVKENWTEDYYNRVRSEDGEINRAVISPQANRRRIAFVPFVLKNDTGCDLVFAPVTQADSNQDADELLLSLPTSKWIKVESGCCASFSFESKGGKQRHLNSHNLKSHQILVQVDNWKAVGPLTVDKVGVYFRSADHNLKSSKQMPGARIVFEITMDGLARKLVTVRSALLLTNLLPYAIELKLENTLMRLGGVLMVQVSPKTTISIPLLYVWSHLFIKPLFISSKEEKDPRTSWIFCREPIQWKNLIHIGDEMSELRTCDSVHARNAPYRMCIYVRRDNFPEDPLSLPSTEQPWLSGLVPSVQPAHSISLASPLLVINLLPFDLHYLILSTEEKGHIKPSQDTYISSVDPESDVALSFWIDNFSPSTIIISSSTSRCIIPLKLQDSKERILYLQVKIVRIYGKSLKINISGFYWLINKTGLPLVFKQEGCSESAGQDQEHEVARCATPLLFSFSDPDSAPMLLVRIGKQLHRNAHPHYCKKFPLTQSTVVRRLLVSPSDHRPDIVYVFGIDVRPGRGRYRDTYMVTLSPRFLLENHSSHELLISQKCFTSTFVDPGAQSTWLRAITGCWLPFHWPRLDKDPLLCVCLCDVAGGYWSGGFPVENARSFNLNIRNSEGQCFFLHVEIVVSDATLFIIFTDAEQLPPPFRIDNFSEVPLTFYQTGIKEARLRSVIRPHTCLPYAWDEITMPPHITCIAPGGTSATYSLNVIGEGSRLTYENFIYIAFTGTFKKDRQEKGTLQLQDLPEASTDYFDVGSLEYLQLVLDVTEGSRVRLNRKEIGCRSQLWRMTSRGMLQHEGSSPPYDPSSKKPRNQSNILVLDIAGPAPLPNEYTPLMLRKPDERRRLTQTWHFTDDGRLCCEHPNLYMQAKDGFLGMNSGSFGKWQLWNDVVLGPPQMIHYATMENGIPVEQAVSRQRLRPGSGQLTIRVSTDGPIRVLQIVDSLSKGFLQAAKTENGDIVYLNELGSILASPFSVRSLHEKIENPQQTKKDMEIEVGIVFQGGLGISFVRPPQELVYALLSDIVLQFISTAQHQTLDCSVRDIQVDNQLPNNQCPVVLYVSSQSKSDEARHLPSIQFSAHHVSSPHQNAFIFKHLIITIKNLTLTIEEDLLYKLFAVAGFDRSDIELEKIEENQYEVRKLLAAATSASATRFYFTHLKLVLDQVRLSVLKAKSLAPELKKIRRQLGLSLVQFDGALVNLDPFIRFHFFETWKFMLDSLKVHYEAELRSQAMRILGSTDFLGNPFGLLADVSEGVQELVREGNVGGLVLNVTHGMANSTAKVTGSLSDAVGKATWDSKHEETRQKILSRQFGNSSDHFMSGLMGFGLGLYGGMTSIISQTYVGASKKGIPGFFSGFAKGVVGTVTKPAVGFLDLATGTASAVRDTSKNPSLKLPSKVRKPRLVIGLNGMIPRYSEKHSIGQEILQQFGPSPSEVFVGYEILLRGEDDLRVLISSEQVLVFSWTDPKQLPTIVLIIKFIDLYQCRPIKLNSEGDSDEVRSYLELTMKDDRHEGQEATGSPPPNAPSQLPTKRPKIRCDSFDIASQVAYQINYARNLHNELKHTVYSLEVFYPDS